MGDGVPHGASFDDTAEVIKATFGAVEEPTDEEDTAAAVWVAKWNAGAYARRDAAAEEEAQTLAERAARGAQEDEDAIDGELFREAS